VEVADVLFGPAEADRVLRLTCEQVIREMSWDPSPKPWTISWGRLSLPVPGAPWPGTGALSFTSEGDGWKFDPGAEFLVELINEQLLLDAVRMRVAKAWRPQAFSSSPSTGPATEPAAVQP
jgi:hypothetical protein